MKLSFDALKYAYPSTRHVVYSRRGMVCTSQSLAAQAGLDILKAGGNAVDAAVATAAAMTVLEPTSNGLGSDAFALVWVEKEKKLYGLNASGPCPMAFDLKEVRGRYGDAIAQTGLGHRHRPRRPLRLGHPVREVRRPALREAAGPRHRLRPGRLPRRSGGLPPLGQLLQGVQGRLP